MRLPVVFSRSDRLTWKTRQQFKEEVCHATETENPLSPSAFPLLFTRQPDGMLLWQKDLDTFTPMSLANSLLYVSAGIPSNRIDATRGLYAFDIHTGAVRWSLTKNIDIDNPFIVERNALYTVDRMGEISAIDALTGQMLWHAQLEIHSRLARQVRLILLDQELFVGTEIFPSTSNYEKYFLDAFSISTHTESWYADITGAETPNYTGIDLGT